jgi:hypothetical protein
MCFCFFIVTYVYIIFGGKYVYIIFGVNEYVGGGYLTLLVCMPIFI